MKKTKEWISDYLRYFLLILAIALLIFLIVITLKVYQRYDKKTSGDGIEILTEADTQKLTEQPSEKMTESETESETERESGTEAETESEAKEQKNGTASGTEKARLESGSANAGAASEAELPSEDGQEPGEGQNQTDGQSQTDGQEQVNMEAPGESTGDYRTIISPCNLRSYPDYGDNVIGECYAGQTVEFLGEEAGWYKISADGTVGYIGPKFLG